MKLTVVGAGAWGSALAIAFSGRHAVTLWARQAEVRRVLREDRENPRFLPGQRFPETLRIADDFAAAVADADLLLIATPLAGLRPTLCLLRDADLVRPLLWACKGLEAETARLPHQVVADVRTRENYLACSVSTRSEIVVLIRSHGKIQGQIDVDSDQVNAFSPDDLGFLRMVAGALGSLLELVPPPPTRREAEPRSSTNA